MCDSIDMNIGILEEEDRIELDIFEDKLNIPLAGDIDFTLFVKKLTSLIPEEKQIRFELPNSENPKIKLVLNTINSIVTSFNESLKQETAEEDADKQ